VVCLDHQAHMSAVPLVVDGAFTATFALSWSEGVTEAKRRFWNDLEEATQQGAYAVAILLIRALTGYTVIERSRKGTGFDCWLGNAFARPSTTNAEPRTSLRAITPRNRLGPSCTGVPRRWPCSVARCARRSA